MNTYTELELDNNDKVKLTLNLKKLIKLKSIDKDLYEAANRIIIKGMDDVLDFYKIIYTGYMCGLEDGASPMLYDEFINNLSSLSIGDATSMAMNLIYAKKK